jgi:hypothetical protein
MKLHIAIPLLDELENIPRLIHDISRQSYTDFKLWFCVNQPDDWWENPERIDICRRNAESMKLISQLAGFPYELIDKSSQGNGWQGKKLGVGWARKTLTDAILQQADGEDVLISLDADTSFEPAYFESLAKRMASFPQAPALSVPYYHPLSGSEAEDRAILRYEIYMRTYLINLFRIGSPYAFTALGSAIALRVAALRTIGGMTPKKSGEDFYLLQKLVKYRPLLQWNEQKVYPAARFSNRVFFGTGPAMIKGAAGDWSSYPVYPMFLFDAIKEFYDSIPTLFVQNIPTPVDAVFDDVPVLWEKLRKNNPVLPQFIKAVHHKFDGLRILQFLKQHPQMRHADNNRALLELMHYYASGFAIPELPDDFSLETASIDLLNTIRDYLCSIEDSLREQADACYGR